MLQGVVPVVAPITLLGTLFYRRMRPETLRTISMQCWSLVDWIFTELRLGIMSKGLVLMTNRDRPVGLLLYLL